MAGDEGADVGAVARCRWCRRVLPARDGPGRPREFCRQACRQWDWVARQRARELALSDGELVIARTELDALRDQLYVMACAVDDVDRDLRAAKKPSAADYRDALQWLLEACRPLCDPDLRPSP